MYKISFPTSQRIKYVHRKEQSSLRILNYVYIYIYIYIYNANSATTVTNQD